MSDFDPHKVERFQAEGCGVDVVGSADYDALLLLYGQACKDRDMHAARIEVNVEYLNARILSLDSLRQCEDGAR
jgi:hypothetical protein